MVILLCLTANAAEPEAVPAEKKAPPNKPLDLRAPDITKLYSAEELEQLLGKAVDPPIEEVEVEGARIARPLQPNTPVVWPGLLAPFWALAHPTQAWRIFAPLPPDQVNNAGD